MSLVQFLQSVVAHQQAGTLHPLCVHRFFWFSQQIDLSKYLRYKCLNFFEGIKIFLQLTRFQKEFDYEEFTLLQGADLQGRRMKNSIRYATLE
jgi:hypothetical protein